MKGRCYNKNNKSYLNYGGKGVELCEEWKNDFISFYEWAINNGYDDSLTIDRIDPDKNYSPDNCQWLTKSENSLKANLQRDYKGFYKVKAISPDGEEYITDNKERFSREHGLDSSAVSKVLKGEYKHTKKWKFEYID